MNPNDKQAMRTAALSRRDSISPQAREAFASRLALQGIEIARRARARTIAAYWPMRGEVDTRYLLEALAYHEFIAALPVMVGRGRSLLFRRWTSRTPMIPADFGVLQPSRHEREVVPEILFTPVVAFDRRGARLGYGGGFYDRTLRELRLARPIYAIGVAFATQEEAEIPSGPTDEPLDFVITETEWIECRTA